jgi:hypothetical protein
MDGFLAWMETSWLARFVLENAWVFPALETMHFFGLILLVGSVYVIDLRLLGFGRTAPLSAVLKFVPVSLVGFAINFTTGIMFLFADPFRYFPNLSFRLKMLAVLLAGLNAVWFKYAVHAKCDTPDPAGYPGLTAKWIAVLSLGLWTAVIILGRMIPYME